VGDDLTATFPFWECFSHFSWYFLAFLFTRDSNLRDKAVFAKKSPLLAKAARSGAPYQHSAQIN
jgi:hypothetical protein